MRATHARIETSVDGVEHPLCEGRYAVRDQGGRGADVKDTSCYELHVRDFSAADEVVPPALRGKYAAFDEDCTGGPTLGQRHLRQLAEAGLTHVHLLPTYDFGSVPEREADQLAVSDDLSQYAPGAP